MIKNLRGGKDLFDLTLRSQFIINRSQGKEPQQECEAETVMPRLWGPPNNHYGNRIKLELGPYVYPMVGTMEELDGVGWGFYHSRGWGKRISNVQNV